MRTDRGVLIIEAVVAAFLMVFAFAASSSLFHAALQWESQSGNVRQAALVAERKIGEIRVWSEDHHAGAPFDDGWAPPITGPQTDYVDAPGFNMTVIADQPSYQSPAGIPNPPPGLYSPTSHFWFPPPVIPALPNDFENAQKNQQYATFARVRTFNSSVRRVQVDVRYGSNGSRLYRAVTLVGDPITPSVGDPTITFTRLAGPANLSSGEAADYGVTVTVSGHEVDDIVCLWGLTPESTGTLLVKPMDSNGRTARVIRPTWGNPGSSKLAVRLRYRGRQWADSSTAINVL